MFIDSSGDDVADARVSGAVLLQHVLTERDVVRQVRPVAAHMLHLHELLQCVLITPFLQPITAAGDHKRGYSLLSLSLSLSLSLGKYVGSE